MFCFILTLFVDKLTAFEQIPIIVLQLTILTVLWFNQFSLVSLLTVTLNLNKARMLQTVDRHWMTHQY